MNKGLFLLRGAAFCALMATAGTASAQSNVSGEIEVWSWDIAAQALQALVPGFNEQHPDVSVTVTDLGNQQVFDRGLAGCAAGGTDLPDVYTVENNEAEVFWSRFPDCFTDLTELGIADLAGDFPDFKWTELTAGDAIYAMPWDAGPVVMFYRRDLYEQAGVDPASIETWDDFIEAGKKIKEASGASMATIAAGSDDDWFRMIANQNGCFYFDNEGAAVTANQPGCVAALDTIKKMTDAGILATGGWNEQIQNIKSGTVAGAMFGAWYEGFIRTNAADQQGQWGVYPMPATEAGGVRAANLGGSALAIPAASENKEAAYAFIEYALASTEGQITMLREFGLVPAYVPALEDPFVQEPQPFWGDEPVWRTILETLNQVPQARGTQFFQEARQIISAVQADYLAGDYDSAQAALDAAADQISGATGLPVAGG